MELTVLLTSFFSEAGRHVVLQLPECGGLEGLKVDLNLVGVGVS